MQTHYFIALALPLEVKQKLAELYTVVSATFPFEKPVHLEDYHITLAFLGAHNEKTLYTLMKNINNHVTNVGAFSLVIDGYGVFGNSSSPRIFWNRLQHEEALFELQQIVAQHCHAHNIQLDARLYNPHITVARKWAGDNSLDLEQLEQFNPLKNAPITFIASEIVLYRTNLESIPKYENIFSIILKNHEPS